MPIDWERMRRVRGNRSERTGYGTPVDEFVDGGSLRESDDVTLIGYDRIVRVTDRAVIIESDGDEYVVPKSLIAGATDEELEVAQWWAEKEGLL